jgi:preprotein translocase subunit SecY
MFAILFHLVILLEVNNCVLCYDLNLVIYLFDFLYKQCAANDTWIWNIWKKMCSLADVHANAFHVLFYVVFMLSACALFSKTWIEVSVLNEECCQAAQGKNNSFDCLLYCLCKYEVS